MTELADIKKGGVDPLRHHEIKYPIETRIVRYGCRVVERDEFGRPIIFDGQTDTIGDQKLAYFWEKDGNKRSISGWSQVWPVTTSPDFILTQPGFPDSGEGMSLVPPELQFGKNAPPGSQFLQTGTAVPDGNGGIVGSKFSGFDRVTLPISGGKCGHAPPVKIRPIASEHFNPDLRFKSLEPKVFKDWPKFPHNWKGISLTTTEEHIQTNLFFPIDPRMIAVNDAGDHEMGSLVCDLKSDFNVAEARCARLQTAFWVIRNWLEGANTLAWNLNITGCNDGGGGLMIDFPSPATEATIPTGPGGGTTKTPFITTPGAGGGSL